MVNKQGKLYVKIFLVKQNTAAYFAEIWINHVVNHIQLTWLMLSLQLNLRFILGVSEG